MSDDIQYFNIPTPKRSKYHFTADQLFIVASMFFLQLLFAILGIPLMIGLLSPIGYGLLIVLSGFPCGAFATFLSNKILGKASAGMVKADFATSLELDGIRGVLFLGSQFLVGTVVYFLLHFFGL